MVQYGSKFVSWVLEQEEVSSAVVQKIRDLEASISTARKREAVVCVCVFVRLLWSSAI